MVFAGISSNFSRVMNSARAIVGPITIPPKFGVQAAGFWV
jgi:hypothetical protein